MILGCLVGLAAARPSAGEPVVVASIFPLGDLAGQVAGGAARVVTLVPPGSSPHAYEPTARQLTELADAQLILVVGLGLDDWVLRAAGRVRQGAVPVLAMSSVLEGEHDGGHGEADHGHDHHGDEDDGDEDDGHDHFGPNPHVWLDPVLTSRWVGLLRDRLEGVCPGARGSVRENARRVLDDLAHIDASYREVLGGKATKELVTFHNAFDRVAERYGLTVVAHLAPLELTPGGEVTPGRLVAAIRAIRRHGLSVVYSEPQFPASALSAIAEQTGARVLTLDPLGSPRVVGYRTYQEMMRSNLLTLAMGQGSEVLR